VKKQPSVSKALRAAFRKAVIAAYETGIPVAVKYFDLHACADTLKQELARLGYEVRPTQTKGRTAKLSASRPPRGVVGRPKDKGPAGALTSRKRKR
jgi:hypothetical protein